MDNLIERFDKLGLRLRPWERRDEIFALTITGDTFFMQTGEGNEVHIQASDKDLNQAVLMVHELPREFEITIPAGSRRPDDIFVRESGRQIVVRRKTEEGTRHMLLGLDERGHPFVTQLPRNAISVKQAHDILKPPSVEGKQVRGKGANYRKRGQKAEQILRQGEWFFIEADQATQDLLATRENLIEKNIPIGPAFSGEIARSRGKVRQWRGNPHVADEVLILNANSRRQVYVRGRVKHAEHATLRFTKWMRIERNTEAGAAAGVSWVD